MHGLQREERLVPVLEVEPGSVIGEAHWRPHTDDVGGAGALIMNTRIRITICGRQDDKARESYGHESDKVACCHGEKRGRRSCLSFFLCVYKKHILIVAALVADMRSTPL